MAFQSKDLSVLAYANGFTLWHYTTVDMAATVDTARYFNTASDMIRVGDMMMANTDTDGILSSGLYMIKSNYAGNVTVIDMTAASAKPTAPSQFVSTTAANAAGNG